MIAAWQISAIQQGVFGGSSLEQGQRRTGEPVLYGTRQFVASLSLLLLVSACGAAAQRAAGVSGVVRDTHGTPQMGVMVELLGAGTSISALTDLQGHYQIRDIVPGVYQLRATAALYLPSLRRQVRLNSGTWPVVNLMMSGLFDDATWISTSRPSADNPDDWKWTLRSPANRPMLRLASDDDEMIMEGLETGAHRGESRSSLSVASSRGGFGSSGDQATVTVIHRSANQTRTVGLRSSLARTETGAASGPLRLSTMLESNAGGLGKHHIDVSMRTFPQMRDASGNSLTEFAVTSAEQMTLGDFAALEVGSQAQLLTSATTILVTHPFVHLTSRPIAGWTASYGFSTQPGLSHYEDLDRGTDTVPTVIRAGGTLKTDSGWHQEIAAGRRLGRTKIRIAYGRDLSRRTALTGRLTTPRGPSNASLADNESYLVPLVSDVSNGTLRMFAQGFGSDAGSVAIEIPLGDDLAISGGYLTDRALVVAPYLPPASSSAFRTAREQSAAIALTGRISKPGTRISASYRWQPARTIGTISPYETAGSSPFLSVHIRQPLLATKVTPAMELTFDGDNLLQEGYQSYALGQQEAFLASALQELRAGLSFTF